MTRRQWTIVLCILGVELIVLAALLYVAFPPQPKFVYEPATLELPSQVLCATLVDTIPLPAGAGKVKALATYGDQLLVVCPADEGGLHCINTADHQLLWSVSLGVFTSPRAPGVEPELIACATARSADGSTIYAGTDRIGQLVAIDAYSGVAEPPVSLGAPWHIFPQTVDGHDVVIVVTIEDIKVLDATELGATLWQESLPGTVSGASYDQATDSLFVCIARPDLLAKYSLDWPDSALQVISASAGTGELPFACKLVGGNKVAVGCTGDGTVRIHDITTLAQLATYPGLDHLGDMEYMDGRVILVSYYSPESGSDSFRGGVMTMDPQTGWSHSEFFDDTYPMYVAPAPIANACCVTDAGREETEIVPDGQGRWKEEHTWVDGHLWTFNTGTLTLLDTEVLLGGHTSIASGGSQNLVYLISPDGTAINAYGIP